MSQADADTHALLPRRVAITVFLAFAGTYFFSALLRAVTATLSPALTETFSLHARDLGLLAGGYFLGFAVMQLPLGAWLDRHGPRKVSLTLLCCAVAGCATFAVAGGFAILMLGRVLMGVGVAACLMAPLTGYRRWLNAGAQLRANAWMLMAGSLGTVASTLPVQWLLPLLGWRSLFWGIALLIVLAMGVLALKVPHWQPAGDRAHAADPGTGAAAYAEVWRHPYFRRALWLGAVGFGGMAAIQALWAGPWLTRVAGSTPLAAATGLFWMNLSMLLAFLGWGWIMPWLTARGVAVERLVVWIQPFSYLPLLALVWAGPRLGDASFVMLAAYCVLSTPTAHVQAELAMRFPARLAGRALSAFNLVIFLGIFAVQWGIGLGADALELLGLTPGDALRGALAGFGLLSAASWLHFVVSARPDNQAS